MTEYTLTRIPQYHIYSALLGPYDCKRDYVGAEGDWKSKYIPRRLIISKVDFNPSAYIHDADYMIGGCEECKIESDKRFYYNMKNAVKLSDPSWIFGLDWSRKRFGYAGARVYYTAVKKFGDDAFNFHNECKHITRKI